MKLCTLRPASGVSQSSAQFTIFNRFETSVRRNIWYSEKNMRSCTLHKVLSLSRISLQLCRCCFVWKRVYRGRIKLQMLGTEPRVFDKLWLCVYFRPRVSKFLLQVRAPLNRCNEKFYLFIILLSVLAKACKVNCLYYMQNKRWKILV